MSRGTIVRLGILLLSLCGLLFAAGVLLLLATGALSGEHHHHAAVVIFISVAALAAAIAFSLVNRSLALAASLALVVLLVDLLFYIEAERQISAALSSECLLGICWVAATANQREIFGFAEFVTALALLVIVYTVTDVRYRFRVQVAPIPLYRMTYVLLAIVGLGTLVVDVWFASRWPVLSLLSDQTLWQAAFAFLFFLVVMTWLWFAFLRPPVFGKRNAQQFAETFFRYILRGWDSELPVIADELVRSARSIVTRSTVHHRSRPRGEEEPVEDRRTSQIAHELLLLIGNRRFCRCVAASSIA